jgi:inhibitor of cysteine peptidase
MTAAPQELVICDPTGEAEARVSVGGHCRVRLSETPSTGYRWQSEFAESNLIQLLEVHYLPDEMGPGAGGKREFLFRATHSGAVVIQFSLRRPWESGPPHQQRFLSISVFNPQ